MSTPERAEQHIDMIIEYVKKHTLSIGILLTIVGILLIIFFMLITAGEGYYWYEWQKEIVREWAFLGAPLFLIGALSLVIGVALLYSASKSIVIE